MGIKVSKYSDYRITLDNNFRLIFNNNKGDIYSFPVIIDKNIEIFVPEYEYKIHSFLQKKCIELEGDDVTEFLKIIKTDIAPFIWLFMQQAHIDVFLFSSTMFVVNSDRTKYIVLNNKNMDLSIFDRLYRNKKHSDSLLYECKEQLCNYVQDKVNNSIGHNDFVNNEIKNYKEIDKALNNLLSVQEINFIEVLFKYENLIRLKEDYLMENHNLMPHKEIERIYEMLRQIRGLLLSNLQYEVTQ